MLFRTSHLLAGSLAVFSAAAASLQLTPDNFDDLIIKSGIPSLVAFTAPWCGHCKNLAPTYEDLAAAFESVKGKVNIAKVDADEHKELGRKFGIQGFPTIKWFDGKTSEPVDYSSGRDLDSLTKFVSENIGVKPKSKPAPSNDLVYLSEDAFRSQVGTKDALVAYTTSCKTSVLYKTSVLSNLSLSRNMLTLSRVRTLQGPHSHSRVPRHHIRRRT